MWGYDFRIVVQVFKKGHANPMALGLHPVEGQTLQEVFESPANLETMPLQGLLLGGDSSSGDVGEKSLSCQ